jgi:outer membrane protein assembly factor BamA
MQKKFTMLRLILVVMEIAWIPLKISAQVEGMATIMPGVGYVVLNNGDTLNGRINFRMKYVENNPVEIKFTAEDGSTRIFNAIEIAGCGIYPGSDLETSMEQELETYVSMPSLKKGVPVFLNRMLDGRLKVFQNRSSIVTTSQKTETTSEFDGIEFRYSREDGLTIGPTYKTTTRVLEGRTRFSSYYVTKDNGTIFKVDKENFDSIFSTLFENCPGIQLELYKNPDLQKFKNFMLLAEVYNQLCR